MNRALEVYLDEVRHKTSSLETFTKSWQKNGTTYIEVADALDEVEIANTDNHSISYNMDAYSFDVQVIGDPALFHAVWAVLRKHGTPNERPKEGDKLPSFSTMWNSNTSEARIWLNYTSTVCKRVQTGTETVEQPVYEIVCGDDDE